MKGGGSLLVARCGHYQRVRTVSSVTVDFFAKETFTPRMRQLVICYLALLILACGCRGTGGKPQTPANVASSPGGGMIVTPAHVLSGKVVRVNPNSRFVVLSFPLGRMPGLEQRMDIYRSNLKVGEIRITGPQRDDKIVADLLAGEAAVGDSAKTP